MAQKNVPRYYGLRIYVSTTTLYGFLIIPFLFFLAIQNIPQIVEKQNLLKADSTMVADSLGAAAEITGLTGILGSAIDTTGKVNPEEVDSMVNMAIRMGESFADSAARGRIGSPVQVSVSDEGDQTNLFKEHGPFARYFRGLFFLILLSYLAGLIYNTRFKRYFKRKRLNREIPENLQRYCKKHLLRTPLVNSIILTLPNVLIILYSLFVVLPQGQFEDAIEKGLFIQFFYLSVVATVLEFLFVYYWQKHRVHIKYIEHIYSDSELRRQVFRRPGGKIRNRLMIASGMTTLLPLLVVMVYLILSLTSIKDLNLESLTTEQREILIGPWVNVIHPDEAQLDTKKYEKFFYVNAVDSIIMLVGIGTGIMVSFIYILLFIKWTNQDITSPVKELLASMRETRTGETEHYTIVRTNDEIGELAEGYNEMTEKIHQYVQSISKMNRELEGKVKERTEEILMQKEEIEAQKEEIEAQLDLATQQRDTISRQKELILDSIRYAERIQSAILPPVEHLSETLTDHFILFRPRDIVSGDYYWTTVKGDKLLIAVADCTGHGVPGAFLSMLGISSMNEIVSRNKSINASQILEYLRSFVIHSLHQTGSKGETQDGIEIALCVIDTRQKTLEYAGANRPLYIVRKKRSKVSDALKSGESPDGQTREETSACKLIQIHGDRMPIGIYDQELLPFTDHRAKLMAGDTVYLFSDGYVDQLGGGSRKTFRSRRFRQLLLKIQDEPMEHQKIILAERLDEWRGEIEQIDDILVIGIKI
jgi:serine phosphatase RsbU (regulator of sigma subunit)